MNGDLTAEPLDQRGPLLGSVDQVAADLERAAGLGVGHVYWHSESEPIEQLQRVALLRDA